MMAAKSTAAQRYDIVMKTTTTTKFLHRRWWLIDMSDEPFLEWSADGDFVVCKRIDCCSMCPSENSDCKQDLCKRCRKRWMQAVQQELQKVSRGCLLASFQRQLNYYGFCAQGRGNGLSPGGRFYHPNFRRDFPENVSDIVRRTNNGGAKGHHTEKKFRWKQQRRPDLDESGGGAQNAYSVNVPTQHPSVTTIGSRCSPRLQAMQKRQHTQRERIFARCRKKPVALTVHSSSQPPPPASQPPPPASQPPPPASQPPFSLPPHDHSEEERPFDLLLQLAFPKVASMITVDSWSSCSERI